nr:unnamed protein product [Callosobruchus chinensis]
MWKFPGISENTNVHQQGASALDFYELFIRSTNENKKIRYKVSRSSFKPGTFRWSDQFSVQSEFQYCWQFSLEMLLLSVDVIYSSVMDEDTLIAIALCLALKKPRKKRSRWSKNWLLHSNALKEHHFEPSDWSNCSRMSEDAYLELLQLVIPIIADLFAPQTWVLLIQFYKLTNEVMVCQIFLQFFVLTDLTV